MSASSQNSRIHHIATFLINVRYALVGLFLLITIAMLFAVTQLRIETGFKKQLPLKHEYMQTFLQYEKEFGGANRVLVALVARNGDMFTPEFFAAFDFHPQRALRRDRRGRLCRRQCDSVQFRAFARDVRAGARQYCQVGRSGTAGLR